MLNRRASLEYQVRRIELLGLNAYTYGFLFLLGLSPWTL